MLAALRGGPRRVTELAEPFDMSLPAISKHLKVLERAELIERHVDGRVHHCALNAEPMEDVSAWLETYRAFWENQLDALAAFVED